jgi:hypothetical protein
MAGSPGLSAQHTAASRNNRLTECGESCTGDQIKEGKNELHAKQIESQERMWQRTLALIRNGARKRTRTSTPLREPGPEPGASASSAIRALF